MSHVTHIDAPFPECLPPTSESSPLINIEKKPGSPAGFPCVKREIERKSERKGERKSKRKRESERARERERESKKERVCVCGCVWERDKERGSERARKRERVCVCVCGRETKRERAREEGERQRENTLQHTATHCNTLQHTATHCNTLQHTATHCNTLQYTATRREIYSANRYGVATISRLLKIICLLCRIWSPLQSSFAKETCNLKEPTNRSPPIINIDFLRYSVSSKKTALL